MTEPCTAWITDDGTATLEQAARYELSCLWGDLQQALSYSAGVWSMQCGGLAARMRRLTVHLGPCPWAEVPTPLLTTGYYERLHAEWGVPTSVEWNRVPYQDDPGHWQWPDQSPLTDPE